MFINHAFKSPACLTFNWLFSLLFVSVLSCLTQHPFPSLSTRPQCQDKRKRQSNIVRHSFDKNWTIVCTCCCLVWSCNLRCLPQPYKCWATNAEHWLNVHIYWTEEVLKPHLVETPMSMSEILRNCLKCHFLKFITFLYFLKVGEALKCWCEH